MSSLADVFPGISQKYSEELFQKKTFDGSIFHWALLLMFFQEFPKKIQNGYFKRKPSNGSTFH